MSTAQLITLFHHRWAAPCLALLHERGGARFVELQRKLGVGRESLVRALDALVELGFVRRNPGYGHPLRPEYVLSPEGREPGSAIHDVLAVGDNNDLLLRKWSVPILAELDAARRFSELRAALPGISPRALALALRELEAGKLVSRTVLDTRPPSTLYQLTAAGERIGSLV